jgi:hypothetical protein
MREIDAIMRQYERMPQQEREAFKEVFRDWTEKSDKLLAEANAKISALAASAARPRLTLEEAKAVAIQALGTANGIELSELADADTYTVRLGRLWCEISPHAPSGEYIEVMILGAYGAAYFLYDPVPLEEDTDAEERYRFVNDRDVARRWVKQNGETEFRALIGEVQAWRASEGDKS